MISGKQSSMNQTQDLWCTNSYNHLLKKTELFHITRVEFLDAMEQDSAVHGGRGFLQRQHQGKDFKGLLAFQWGFVL